MAEGPWSKMIQLHIYDLTRGLVAELSPSLLGEVAYTLRGSESVSSFRRLLIRVFFFLQEKRLMEYGTCIIIER